MIYLMSSDKRNFFTNNIYFENILLVYLINSYLMKRWEDLKNPERTARAQFGKRRGLDWDL